MLSMRLDAERVREDRDRISLGSTMNYDQDPGTFDGVGGVDAEVAGRLVNRFGAGALPGWVEAMTGRS